MEQITFSNLKSFLFSFILKIVLHALLRLYFNQIRKLNCSLITLKYRIFKFTMHITKTCCSNLSIYFKYRYNLHSNQKYPHNKCTSTFEVLIQNSILFKYSFLYKKKWSSRSLIAKTNRLS